MGQIWHLLTNCFLFINHHLNLVLDLFLPTGENGVLLECLGIIMAFISYQNLEQQLKHSALIQTDEDAAEAPWDNP